MNSGNTVILPLKERRVNPISGKEEIMDTGMVAEFHQGKQVSAPFRMPSLGDVAQDRAVPSSISRPEETYRATIYSGDTRNLAQHYQRSGETTRQAAERLGEAASRFEVTGNRATATASALPVGSGHQQPATIAIGDPRAYASTTLGGSQ
ncbi:hypothetical protein [Variovorax boronicumulans]|uniref:hypothetical protein n=1 Tax=Variovorax boronicumulans TaxID=436515 RepID=UPI00339A8FBB